jgi:hypothetical protein
MRPHALIRNRNQRSISMVRLMATTAKGDSCWDKAAPDEPLFVLRAQDATAPEVVEYWLYLNPHLQHTVKGYEARDLANQMRTWQNERMVKIAD